MKKSQQVRGRSTSSPQMTAMHVQPAPKHVTVPSPVAKTAPRRLPFVGMRNPSLADKKVAQHHFSASFDSSEFVAKHPVPESRGEALHKLTDPRGHLLDMLDIKPPRDQNDVDVDFLRERGPTKVKTRDPPTKPAATNPLLRAPVFRNASSFCSRASSADDRHADSTKSMSLAVRRGSTSLTLRSSDRKPGSVEVPSSHDEEGPLMAVTAAIARHRAAFDAGVSSVKKHLSQDEEEHAPSRPTRLPSPGHGGRCRGGRVEEALRHGVASTDGPRPLRSSSDAARLLPRNHHGALTRAPSDPATAPPPPEGMRLPQAHHLSDRGSQGRIRIVWQPPSNFTFGILDDLPPERTTLNPEPFATLTPKP